MSSRKAHSDDRPDDDTADSPGADVSDEWSYYNLGGVVIRNKPMQHLSRDAYIRREIETSKAIGDPRSDTEIRAAVERELDYQAEKYPSPVK
ncbi:MAG TPA: hypothetical protein VFX16_08060 [Pseudonocardiaceae bacterium]|nr:hypothetical protein [Pseudonocardiaceae bacterium]